MCRSLWKLNYNNLIIFIKNQINKNSKIPFLTKNRHQPIYPIMINNILSIYDGKKYVRIRIENDNYFYHKFGEFSIPIAMGFNLHKKKTKSEKRKK